MKLTVGVLTYNSEHMLPELLESLPAGLAGVEEWQVFIVDSGSTDATAEVAAKQAPDAKFIDLGSNRGFAAGVNAASMADPFSDAVLILSPTTRLTPGGVRPMLNALAAPGVGIVVPRLVDLDGKPKASLRRRPTLARVWGETLLGTGRPNKEGLLSEMIGQPESYGPGTAADWATGAVTMISRECLTAAGPWDEDFFLYSEETEFALRAADHGYALRLAPLAVAMHIGGVSKARPELWALTCANRVRLFGMRHTRLAAWNFWLAIMVGEVTRLPYSRPATRRAAIGKLLREARSLVAGRPARHPYPTAGRRRQA